MVQEDYIQQYYNTLILVLQELQIFTNSFLLIV